MIAYVMNQLSEVYRDVDGENLVERAVAFIEGIDHLFDTPMISFSKN